MRKNTTFVGACKNCDRYCLEQSKQAFVKNHKDDHTVYTHAELEKKVQTHFQETTVKAYQRKLALLRQYFKEARQKMDETEKKVIRQFKRKSLQQSFNVQNNIHNAKKTESLARYADVIIEGKLKDLTCDNADFLLRGLDRVDKCLDNGWRPDFSVLNQCFKQVENEVGKSMENLRKEYLSRMENLDATLKKDMRDIRQKRVYNHRNGKSNQKITLVKNAEEGKQFAIKVRVDRIIANFKQKKLDMVVFIGRDSSGTSFITYKKHEYIEPGNTVKIDRCQIQEHNGKKQIGGFPQADITLMTQQKERQRQKDRDRRDNRDNRENRQNKDNKDRQRERQREREREKEKEKQRETIRQKQRLRDKQKEIQSLKEKEKPRRNREEMRRQQQTLREPRDYRPIRGRVQKKEEPVKRGKIHEEVEQQNYGKVKQIGPDSQDLTLCVKILQIKKQTVTGLICVIGDETGIVNAELPAKQQCVKESGVILITNGQSEVRDEHVIVVMGPNGRVKRSLKNLPKIGLANNVSAESWVEGD